jgi:uncharacterized membrane protein
MFCQNCGGEVQVGQTFCSRCGAPQPAIGPAVTSVQPYVPPQAVRAQTGHWIGAGWNLVKDNLLLSIVAVIVVAVMSSVVPFILTGPTMVGFHYFYARALKGQKADLADLFYGFNFFVPAMAAGVIISVFTMIGFAFLIIPGLILMALFSFTYLFISDKRMDFWPAMMASVDLVKQDLLGFTLFLFVAAGVLNFLGVMCFLVGVLVTAPIYVAAVTVAYKEIVGFSD